jgi:flagellin
MTVVNTNVAALAAQSSMMKNTRELEDAMAKLSSGHRINTAADDAAGLSISERLDSQIKGLSQAIRNSQDGQNLIDTVEGASGEVVVALQRLRELAVQAANDTNSAVDRGFIQVEAQQLISEINRIGSTTQWNGMNVLDGSFVNKTIQTGANKNNNIAIGLNDIKARSIGNHVIRGAAIDNGVAAAGESNSIAAGNTVIAGFAGTATVASI